MIIPKYLESAYFDEKVEMHYALLQSADKIGPVLHTHDFFEVFLLIEGQIEHVVNGNHITLIDGSMTLIRPNDAHFYRPIPGYNCQVINLAIARRAINDLFDYLGDGFHTHRILDLEMPPTINLAPAIKEQVKTKLEQLHSIPVNSGASQKTALRMLLFELITQYFPLVTQENRNELPEWLQRTCEEMQKPQNLALGVPRMLELSAVSAEHLARTVRKLLDQTPTNYVNQLRLTFAANLLTHGDRAILDIASEVGFESLSYFYTLFKAHYGQTPRQFRRNHLPQLLHG
ncbi:MAG: AraC family transcriptional regulator [Chloroflexi bacterium]|nr:MAG: AraC family transcriptional regulator [Chloroflexota bacterium]